ncbi:MAG TPA: hypothetical protein VMP68_18075 [Candidatus Eisenbacteria bacterium]|nr:hypothetical protein [Candidatus Eisenbacteria bacterium]
MKAKLANRFVFAVHREVNAEWARMMKNYTEEQKFYINLGREMTEASLATLVGANNNVPKTGPKYYVHSARKSAL